MSEKKRCTIDVTETETGLKVELSGQGVKDCLARLVSCCSPKKSKG